VIAVLLAPGVVALIVGVVYLTVAAGALPSFLGQLHRVAAHRTDRGLGAVTVGGVLVVAAALVARFGRPPRGP
jgi:hypothetical protein